MEFPKSHPSIEKELKDQGLTEASINLILKSILGTVIKQNLPTDIAVRKIANGLLSFADKLNTWRLTPEGMAFDNWAKENPKDAIESIYKAKIMDSIMKNREN